MADKMEESSSLIPPLNPQADQSQSEPEAGDCSSSSVHRRSKTTKSKSMDKCPEEQENDVSQRRLSHGDDPLWLGQENEEADKVEMDFLLGRANKCDVKKIRITEVAPLHSSIREDDSDGWKMPVEIFSKKKQANVKHKSKRLRSYYKAQDELITAYEHIALDVETDVEPVNVQNTYTKAILFANITLFINFLLLVAKAVASALSGSIAIISSLVDSCLDIFSGVIMWWATRAVKRRDPYNYPQGRTKLEPVAIIILSVVMALCSIQLIRESLEKIIHLSSEDATLPNVDYVTFAISGSTVVIKLVLWLIYRRVHSSIVQALAQDHRNDVLSNTVAIICGYLGSKNFKSITDIYGFAYIDPVGAILISAYIMFNWWQTGSEQIKMLTGQTARPDFLSKLTWMCLNHHPEVKHIDTVRAFHFGSNFLVEVDIILPEDTILREAHNIGESLQHRLESLPEVERAFVHLDFEFKHNPHSEHKIV